MARETNLRELAISDTGFIFDPRTGATFSVNATGLLVLRGLRDGVEPEALVASLAERFGRPTAEIGSDLADFLQLLRQHALLPAEPSAALPPDDSPGEQDHGHPSSHHRRHRIERHRQPRPGGGRDPLARPEQPRPAGGTRLRRARPRRVRQGSGAGGVPLAVPLLERRRLLRPADLHPQAGGARRDPADAGLGIAGLHRPRAAAAGDGDRAALALA
jgi:hypothetical protein